MKKKQELFYFFQINDADSFKRKLHTDIVPLVTSVHQLLSTLTQPVVALNIAFSQSGLNALNITDDLSDPVFSRGQFADAAFLGDVGGGSGWVAAFKGTAIHGVFILASDDAMLLDAQKQLLEITIGEDMTVVSAQFPTSVIR